MVPHRPGELIDKGALIKEIDFSPFHMRVSTERERQWMRVWLWSTSCSARRRGFPQRSSCLMRNCLRRK